MRLDEYAERLRRAGVPDKSACHWCRGVDTGTRFSCVCGSKDCGSGICPASVVEFVAPAVPTFK